MQNMDELEASLRSFRERSLEDIAKRKEELYEHYTAAMAILDKIEADLRGSG